MRAVLGRHLAASCLLLLLSHTALAQEANRPAASGKAEARSPASIEKYLQYYLDLYGENLKSPDWMARAMGVISLARIDEPRVTQRLLEVMKKDALPIVQLFAWEALHARQDKLAPGERAEWVRSGLQLGDQGAFRGELRVGFVHLLGELGPTPANKQRFSRLFETTNSMHPGDVRTLWAMGDVLKDWQSPDLVKALIQAMSKLEDAYRAELVLGRLFAPVGHCSTWQTEGSSAMWTKTQQQWAEWFQKAGLKETAPSKAAPYKDLGEMLPRGEVLADTSQEQWRRDLELPRFRLGQLDVGIALDTTASMTAPLEWVKQDLRRMMKMFELISREPRIGITLYRDHGDAYLTRTLPLTDNAAALAEALKNEKPKGGGDIPEAILEGLTEVVKNQKWSTGSAARKIVVLIGDAPPHEETLKKIELLVTASAQSGFSFFAVKVRTDRHVEAELNLPDYDPDLTTFDKIAEWGGGGSLWVDFERLQINPRSTNCAQPLDADDPQRLIFRQVLTAALPKGYRDRVDPFVRVLLEYVDEPGKETREPFPRSAAPSGQEDGAGRHSAPRPQPPSDPQQTR